jgi:FRG domain
MGTPDRWDETLINSESQISHVLAELRGKRWLSRGLSKCYGGLVPSIDRDGRDKLARQEKLSLERQSIDIFQATARYFATPAEEIALKDDFIALCVLRHYGVPTRLLDWSKSPYVAAYFAACDHDKVNGEIWTFNEPLNEDIGRHQWKKWPETTSDRTGARDKFDPNLTAFTLEEPPNWFICGFYNLGFPRQNAQQGVYTITARFNRDHADAIADLFGDKSQHHRYVISAKFKPGLRRFLREKHGIWQGSLFPDAAGAAGTAHKVFSMVARPRGRGLGGASRSQRASR